MFKSTEEREAERARKEAEQAERRRAEEAAQAQERVARERAAFLASPLGRATTAKEAGEPFFEIQLDVASHKNSASWGAVERGVQTSSDSGRTLGEIEQVGWRLEHAGYVYMVTEQTSTERVFLSGEATAVSGKTVGIYLFRNAGSDAVGANDSAGVRASSPSS